MNATPTRIVRLAAAVETTAQMLVMYAGDNFRSFSSGLAVSASVSSLAACFQSFREGNRGILSRQPFQRGLEW